MARHAAHGEAHRAAWTWQRILLLVGIALSLLGTVAGMVRLWPGDATAHVSPEFNTAFALNRTLVPGTVTLVDSHLCSSPSVGQVFENSPREPLASPAAGQADGDCTRALVDLTGGANAGKRTMLVTHNQAGEPTFEEGQRIMLAESTSDSGATTYSFADYDRGRALLVWAAAVVLAMLAFASWRGVRALLGLVIALAIITGYLLPALATGGNPLALAVVSGAAIILLAVPLVHGLNWKSAAALGGTLVALGLAALLTVLALRTTHVQGLGDEENLTILVFLPGISVTGLMLCGFIIGALGVLNDATVSQASTVNELVALDSTASPWRLFMGAMSVGRDHIASMVYTLVLTYAGAALPLLLLISVADRPVGATLSSDIMATELMRSGVGTLALLLAVPLTTLIAAWTVPNTEPDGSRTPSAGGGHGHAH